MPCVVSQDGDIWTIDTEHKDYPRAPQSGEHGAGAELKKLLAAVGIHATPGCSCESRAREMNARGTAWCKQNVGMIVEWLSEEASARKLFFSATAAKLVVLLAIRNAEKLSRRHSDTV